MVVKRARIKIRQDADRTWVRFYEKPSALVRAELRRLGYQWSARHCAWWR